MKGFLVTVLIVLGIWFVSSFVLGLLAARFLRFSEASGAPEKVVGSSPATSKDTIDDESEFFRSLIASRQQLSSQIAQCLPFKLCGFSRSFRFKLARRRGGPGRGQR